MNKIFTIGRLATDPTVNDVSGRTCASFSFASDTKRKNEAGDYVPIFYRVTAWGNLGETCAKYLHKGDMAAITGDLSASDYTDSNGKERRSIEIRAEDVRFVGGKRKPDQEGSENNQSYQQKAQAQENPKVSSKEDDLPF